jgi:hypothetical protein
VSRITRLEAAAIFALIVLAAILRLGYAGVNPFASDEARLSVLALEMGREGHLIRTGIPNSAGSRNLPASVYAFVPPYLLSTDPLIATQYVGVLNLMAVFGIWWITKCGFGAWSAWIAALFAASAPFAVFFSRNIWTQNLLIPMAVLWLIASHIAITTDKLSYKRMGIGTRTGNTLRDGSLAVVAQLASDTDWWRNHSISTRTICL